VLHWMVRQLGLKEPSDLSRLAANVAPGANGLCFLPYFSPAGERVPFLNTGARGSLFGLSFEHGREHIARAILEGLSLVIRDCFQAAQEVPVPLQVCGLCGGGANNEVWCQLIADIAGTPTFRTIDQEVGAKGAFIVGLVAVSQETDYPSAAKKYVQIRDVFEPNKESRACYDDLFEQFLAIRESTLPIWKRMAGAKRQPLRG
jgi:erythritol kinase (D-erythritol 1-phosphate-forming)